MLILFAYVSDTDSFVGRLNFSPANDHSKRYCAKATSKKSELSRDGREGEVSGEGGFELGCVCSPTRNLLPPQSDSFFQRRLFFSREKKSASRRTANHTFRLAYGVYALQDELPKRKPFIYIFTSEQKAKMFTKRLQLKRL